jgi:hypothetical protein
MPAGSVTSGQRVFFERDGAGPRSEHLSGTSGNTANTRIRGRVRSRVRNGRIAEDYLRCGLRLRDGGFGGVSYDEFVRTSGNRCAKDRCPLLVGVDKQIFRVVQPAGSRCIGVFRCQPFRFAGIDFEQPDSGRRSIEIFHRFSVRHAEVDEEPRAVRGHTKLVGAIGVSVGKYRANLP